MHVHVRVLFSDQSSNERKPSHIGAAVSHNHSQGQGQEDSAMHRPKQQPMRSLDSADRRDDNKVMSCHVMSCYMM